MICQHHTIESVLASPTFSYHFFIALRVRVTVQELLEIYAESHETTCCCSVSAANQQIIISDWYKTPTLETPSENKHLTENIAISKIHEDRF